MQKYLDQTGKSDISQYEIQSEIIRIKFNKTNKTLVYSYQKAGKAHVENLKKLALEGKGLSRYIRKHLVNLHDYETIKDKIMGFFMKIKQKLN